jgi:hypothetical protein
MSLLKGVTPFGVDIRAVGEIVGKKLHADFDPALEIASIGIERDQVAYPECRNDRWQMQHLW